MPHIATRKPHRHGNSFRIPMVRTGNGIFSCPHIVYDVGIGDNLHPGNPVGHDEHEQGIFTELVFRVKPPVSYHISGYQLSPCRRQEAPRIEQCQLGAFPASLVG